MSTINIYDLNYTDAFKLGIRNYANFNGRVSRSEYWRFVAGVTLIQGLLGIYKEKRYPYSNIINKCFIIMKPSTKRIIMVHIVI